MRELRLSVSEARQLIAQGLIDEQAVTMQGTTASVVLDERSYDRLAEESEIVDEEEQEGTNCYGMSTGGRQLEGNSDAEEGQNDGAINNDRGNYPD